MAIRLDEEGYNKVVDAVQSGSTSSGARVYDDGVPQSPFINRPWAGREEFIMNEAMQIAQIPAEEIRKIKPIVPQTLFPDYNLRYDRQALTIDDALNADRWRPTVRSWISGPSRQVRRADMQEDLWSGSLRGASNNPAL